MSESKKFNQHAATTIAHAGGMYEESTGGIVPAISPATTFVRESDYSLKDESLSYSRAGTSNWRQVECLMRDLEGGADALLFSSGLSAATTIFHTLNPGDHVVIPSAMYHGMRDWVTGFCGRWGVDLDQYQVGDLDSLQSKIRPGATRIVWVETPANPTWEVTDIQAASDIAHAANALCFVDSTVVTPLITRALDYGADYVMHSATKYLNGHSDILGGVLVCSQEDQRWQQIRDQRTGGGAVIGTFEAWLLLRGLRTLDVRLQRSCSSALELARFLQQIPGVSHVLYPGLESHPGHDIAKKQMQGGFGGMLSFRVSGGEPAAAHVATHTHVFRPATSLGGVESLIEHRALVESPGSPTPRDLLRLSTGIEHIDDLKNDLAQALEAMPLGG